MKSKWKISNDSTSIMQLVGGFKALSYEPEAEGREFHISGKPNIARYLITKWAAHKCAVRPNILSNSNICL